LAARKARQKKRPRSTGGARIARAVRAEEGDEKVVPAASTIRSERAQRRRDRASEASAAARDFARRARENSVARVRDLGAQARERVNASREALATLPLEPHLCFVQSPRWPIPPIDMPSTVRVATYNVHRWQGVNGRAAPDIARAGEVITELGADVIALQEVLRPFPEDAPPGDDLF
jgi:hypothetical protein